MTENYFSGLDISGASDDPFGMPNGTHAVTITSAEIAESKKENGTVNKGFVVEFTSAEDTSKSITKWNSLPNVPVAQFGKKEERMLSFLKIFFRQLEIPESRMDNVGPDDLLGLDLVIEVKDGKNGFKDIAKISRTGGIQRTSGSSVSDMDLPIDDGEDMLV